MYHDVQGRRWPVGAYLSESTLSNDLHRPEVV